MKETIFDNIVKNENSFTELFKSFLRFKFFRHSFLRMIGIELDLDNIGYEDFDTQYPILEHGIPDLALVYDDVELFFEIKVLNTTLTENQPKGYYAYLNKMSKAKIKGLILIIPEDYYNLSYYNQCLQSINKEEDNVFTQIIYWESILKIITGNEINEISPLFSEYSVFIDNWFKVSSIYYDSLNVTTMFGKHFPESLHKTIGIIDNLFNEFKKRDYKLRWSSDKYFTEYGFYFILPDEEDKLFFGIWFDYWLDSGNPICIALNSNSSELITTFHAGVKRSNLNTAKIFDENWYVTFVDQQTFTDENCELLIKNILFEISSSMNMIESVHQLKEVK